MSEKLTQRLLDRARRMAWFLRMDALGDIHFEALETRGGEVYWICEVQAGQLPLGFYLFEDGAIQLKGSYNCDVSPWALTVRGESPARSDVLGDGSGACNWPDSLSQLDMFAERHR